MKRYTHSAIILLAALSLVGCSKTEEFHHNSDSTLQIESVSGISPFALMQEPVSKAVISGENLPVDEASKGIGLFVTAAGGGAYDGKTSGYSNVKYAYSSEKWSAASPIYLSNTTGKLYGYFPYNADATNLTAIPVVSSLNGTDYLYAISQDVSFTKKSVNLKMNHALARLHLTINKGDKYLSNCSLTKIVLKSKAIDASGTMDITTGAVTEAKAADEIGTIQLAGTDAVTASGIEKDILLVPADNSEGPKDLTLTLTIDGIDAGVKFTGDKGLDIRSGIQNNVTLTIEDTGIKVTGVGVGIWGDGGSQTVEVGGYTVSVKLSSDATDAGIADDLIVQVASNGSSVIVKTYSDSGKKLVIRNDDATIIAPTEDGNRSTFTFSDVKKDITATLAYAKTRTVTFNTKVDKGPNVEGYVYGTADPITVLEGRPSTLTATPGNGYAVDYFNVKGTKYGDKEELLIPNDVESIDVYFRFSDWLGGVFSVSDTKKILFSKGNLWCDGTGNGYKEQTPIIKSWGFESTQYARISLISYERPLDHISHFMWCKDASNSICQRYSADWNKTGVYLFTNSDATTPNSDFTVNGQKGLWRTLSGWDDGEWKYLLDNRKTAYGTNRRYAAVKVNDMAGLLLFPDDFSSWPSGAGVEPKTFNECSYWNHNMNYTVEQFNVLQDNGCVFLSAAGERYGGEGSENYDEVYNVGDVGYYWSSVSDNTDTDFANNIEFKADKITQNYRGLRSYAYAIRLVTDVQ